TVTIPRDSMTAYNSLQKVWVQENRFHFDDLYTIVNQLSFLPLQVFNGTPIGTSGTLYVPNTLLATGTPFDTLNAFIYWPQDSAGIGGVRRRPAGDSVLFSTTVGEPSAFRKNDVVWLRTPSLVTPIPQIIATANTQGQGIA